jgi:hypothetical protein
MFRTPPRPPADRNYEKLIAKEKLLVGHISIKQQENFCQTPPPCLSPHFSLLYAYGFDWNDCNFTVDNGVAVKEICGKFPTARFAFKYLPNLNKMLKC